jgi:hypothetical protein
MARQRKLKPASDVGVWKLRKDFAPVTFHVKRWEGNKQVSLKISISPGLSNRSEYVKASRIALGLLIDSNYIGKTESEIKELESNEKIINAALDDETRGNVVMACAVAQCLIDGPKLTGNLAEKGKQLREYLFDEEIANIYRAITEGDFSSFI